MRTMIFLLAATLFAGCSTMSAHDEMQADVDQAATVIERFQSIPEQSIPPAVIKGAKGLAIMTVTKAGFIASGRGGKGVLIDRVGNGWSGPCAIGTGGVGFGFQAGAEVTEFVFVLNTPAAVDAFAKQGNITLGGNLSVAAGPIGRTAEGSLGLGAAIYAYSISQGLFGGVSVEGTVISVRDDANEAYYGRPVTAGDILSGRVQAPAGARRLINDLQKY